VTNKEINRVSGRIFESLLPPNWAFRSQEDQEDYGIDGEIEITTPDDKATGVIFKVQLKGTEHAEYDATGQLVYSAASVERFSYYVHQLKVPVIFVVCDVTKQRCFWIRVQGQPDVEGALKSATAQGQHTFTLKFSTLRAFDQTDACSTAIVEAATSAMDTITLRSLKNLPGDVVGKHLASDADIIASEKKFRLFAAIASTEAIAGLVRSGEIDRALSKAKALFESAAEEPAVRIQVGILFANVYGKALHQSAATNAAFDAARFRLGVADAMLRIIRLPGCEPQLRLYTRVYARASRLQVNARVMLALAISEKVQRRQGETLAGPLTAIQRIQATGRVTRDFLRIRMILVEAMNRKSYSLIPYIVDEWLEVSLPFLHALQLAEQNDAANGYAEALWQVVPLAVDVAKTLLGADTAGGIIRSIGLRVVGLGGNDVVAAQTFIARYEQELTGEKLIACGAEIIGMMRELLARAHEGATRKPSMAERRAYFEQQAAALGINLDDPHDRIAQVVRVGLEDLDPTRVARNCRHIHLRHGPYGIPAEMLGLPSAGSKSVICLKHGHSMQGFKLDMVYEHFSRRMPWSRDQRCCEDCTDRDPHPEGWNWSDEWAAEQEARYAKAKRGGPA
jgi:hypothetical protein